jgi:hypothetical protein
MHICYVLMTIINAYPILIIFGFEKNIYDFIIKLLNYNLYLTTHFNGTLYFSHVVSIFFKKCHP